MPVRYCILALLLMLAGSCGDRTTAGNDSTLPPSTQCQRKIRKGDREGVIRCLKAHPELLQYRSQIKGTLLHYAARNNQPEIARTLVEMGIPIDERDAAGYRALDQAALDGEAEVGIALLELGADPVASLVPPYVVKPIKGVPPYPEPTPIDLAAMSKCGPLVQELLDRGADAAHLDSEGRPFYESALHYACRMSVHRDSKETKKKSTRATIRILVDELQDVNLRDRDQRTPLHVAAEWGSEFLVEFLLNEYESIDINAQDAEGNTPLHLAIDGSKDQLLLDVKLSPESSFIVSEVLVSHGAKLDIRNDSGQTPLNMARSKGQKDLIELLNRPQQ